jgi:nucleoside-diphosphate kinase
MTTIPEESGKLEQTLIMIKPDSVRRNLAGNIIARFEARGFRLIAMKMIRPTEEQLREHYWELAEKRFFGHLIDYMMSGPVIPMVFERVDAIKEGRRLLGMRNPAKSDEGTIRGDYGRTKAGRTVYHDYICHGSDGEESSKLEIGIWFKPEELMLDKIEARENINEKTENEAENTENAPRVAQEAC